MVHLQWFVIFEVFKTMFSDATNCHQFETVECEMEIKDKFDELSKWNPKDSNLINLITQNT